MATSLLLQSPQEYSSFEEHFLPMKFLLLMLSMK